MREEIIICIGCPMGCQTILMIDDKGAVAEITGCKCKEGNNYVIEEYRNPVRVLTGTVLTEGSLQPLLPVRTNSPIPKQRLKEGAKALANLRVKSPIRIGEVVLPNLLGIGADVIATSEVLA